MSGNGKRRVFALLAGTMGLVAALLISEIIIRVFYPERIAAHTRLPGSSFVDAGIDGLSLVFAPNVVGLTNPQGLVNVDPIPESKPAGERRLLVVSDSLANAVAGQESTARLAFPSRLQHHLGQNSAVKVLNLSSPGLSLRQELILVEHRGLKFEPDAILFVYCINDVVETEVENELNVRTGFPSLLHLNAVESYRREQNDRGAWYRPGSPVFERLKASFSDLGELAKTIDVAVAPMPVLSEIIPQPHLKAVPILASKEGIPVIDLASLAPLSTWEQWKGASNDVVHLSAEGHDRVGALLAGQLADWAAGGEWFKPAAGLNRGSEAPQAQ